MLVPESLAWLQEYAGLVNSEIDQLHLNSGSTALERAVADALSIGGKRVRATLALLWCEVYSGDPKPAVPLGVAYELAHASALVQDDIIDHAGMRRGEKSISAKYGLETALLASDLLLFNVPKMVAKYGYLEGQKLAKVFDLVGEACRATTWGEFLDLQMAQGAGGNEKDYDEMIRLKTSTLLSAPCASGAMVGGASDEDVDVASKFGEEVGMAYQIQDDILDLVGDEDTLGKPRFMDLRGGKKGVVLAHCVSLCTPEEKGFVSGLLGRTGAYTKEEISKLLALIERYGSLEYASEMVARHTRRARAALESVREGRAKSRLLELTDYLATRYY